MKTQHVDTVILGAGQAGLSAAHQLKRRGVDCLALDGIARIGDQWRNRYDSLRLFTPAFADSLQDLRFPGDQQAFPSKDEMADYLELYAITHGLPIRLQSRVRRLRRGRRIRSRAGAGGPAHHLQFGHHRHRHLWPSALHPTPRHRHLTRDLPGALESLSSP